MSPEEIGIHEPLVQGLIARQFSQWADLPIAKVSSAGTDNAIYRLGDELILRLPRLARAADMVDREQRWLPRLTPHLPLAIPVPLAEGAPDDEFPLPVVGVPVAQRRQHHRSPTLTCTT